MWPFKKKIIIKENKHTYPYSRMRNDSSNYSVWDNLSIIEKFAMIGLPMMLCFMIWMMCDAIAPDLHWGIRLPISVGIVAGIIGLITGIVNFFSERY